ncbi:MAG: hypothetical protein ABUJ92_00080 [Desulfobacterales bacterium]
MAITNISEGGIIMDRLKYFKRLAGVRLEIMTKQDIKVSELLAEIERLQGEVARLRGALKTLSRSAAIVSHSLNSGDFVPEFRYKDFEKNIKEAKEQLKEVDSE